MNRFVKIALGIAVALLILSSLTQGLALYGTLGGAPDVIKEIPWLIPVWVTALVLIPVATILCAAGKKSEKLSLVAAIVAVVGAVLALVAALTLRDALPTKVAGTNVSLNYDQGLDAWKLAYRHLTSVVAGALVAVCGFVNHSINRQERIRLENEQYVDQYELPKSAEEETPDRKLKKSLRVARRKNEE